MSRTGFVLVELLVAIAAALLVLAIIVATFMYFEKKHYNWEGQVAEMQENLRAGMEMMKRELAMAGSDPGGTAGAGLVVADSDTIRFTMDRNGDGVISGTDEDVTYALDTKQRRLMRNSQSIAENITKGGLRFKYFDRNNHEFRSTPLDGVFREKVSRINVQLSGRTAKPDPDYPLDGGYRKKTVSSNVLMRNLALARVSTAATTTIVTTTALTTSKATTTKATTTRITATVATTTSETTTTEYVDTEGPKVSEISQVPFGSPIPNELTVSVCAAVTDPSEVASVTLLSDRHGSVAMTVYAGDTYCADLAGRINERVTYYIVSHDALGNESVKGPYSYHQGK